MGWRRVGAAATAMLAVALGLTGCSSAPTVGDGSVGGDWAVLPTPSVTVPVAGACTTAPGEQAVSPWGGSHDDLEHAWTLAFLPGSTVDCAQSHLTETYYVGAFPADVDTDPNTVPVAGSSRFRYAYTTCVEQ